MEELRVILIIIALLLAINVVLLFVILQAVGGIFFLAKRHIYNVRGPE